MAPQPRRPAIVGLLFVPLFLSVVAMLLNMRATARAMADQQFKAAEAVRAARLRRDAETAATHAAAHAAARAGVPACARGGARSRSFVLLFMGHSGSTALISALAQHPQVLVRGFEPVDHGALAEDHAAALAYADRFFSESSVSNLTAGFKLRPRHVLSEPARWAALFRKHGTRIVWNYRQNVFKQAVGHYPIVYLNDHSRYEGLAVGARNAPRAKRDRITRFRIHDMSALHALLVSRLRGEAEVGRALGSLASQSCVFPLSYEMLLKRPEHTQLSLQAFLGLDLDGSLHAARSKATGDNLCDVVTNWKEVCNAFFGCHRWRGMMDDVDNGCACPVNTGMQQMRAGKFCSDHVERPSPRHKPGASGRRKEAGASKDGSGHRTRETTKKHQAHGREAHKPEARKPEARKLEAHKPEAHKPEARKLEARKPDNDVGDGGGHAEEHASRGRAEERGGNMQRRRLADAAVRKLESGGRPAPRPSKITR